MTRISDNNLWQATSVETFQTDCLSGEYTTDFVIIGGGFTGCSAAVEARKLGMDVCLLEANTIGHGGSGRNVGLVNAGLWTPPDQVEEILGVQQGTKLNTALANGPKAVFQLIQDHDIQCEVNQNGTLHCAHSLKGFDDLHMRYEQQLKRNAPVDLLSAKEARSLTGANNIFGALRDRRAGTVQPLAYVKGLARAAKGLGAQLYEHSPVISAQFINGYWVVKTEQGKVKAKHLLNATNAYLEGDIAHYQPSFTPVYYFQFATKPLSQDLQKEILPEKNGCWDTATVMSSFRMDEMGRLIMGSIGSLENMGQKIHQAWVQRKALKVFPQLEDVHFDYSWHGRIAMTDDHLPRLIQSGENAVTMMGYNGRGISPGTTMGQAISRFFADGDEDVLPVQLGDIYRQNMNGLKEIYYETGASLTHFIKDR